MRTGPLVMAALGLLLLTACGPQTMTRATAERLCEDEARLADGIAGSVGIGGGSEGASGRGSLTITSDILNPRPEAEALEACISRRMAGDRSAPRRSGLTVAIEGDFR